LTFVLDNSVTMRWCFGDGKPSELAYAAGILDALRGARAQVPTVWGLEVANVLARAEDRGLITEARSGAFLALLRRLRIEADAETFAQSLTGILQLARRYRLSAYDAAYLELALREGLALATLDVDLRKAARRAGVPIAQ
jgi:predicted nucleic acid-binding protein